MTDRSEIPETCREPESGEILYRGTLRGRILDSQRCRAFAELGFEQISIEPVVGEDTDPYAIRESDLPQIFSE